MKKIAVIVILFLFGLSVNAFEYKEEYSTNAPKAGKNKTVAEPEMREIKNLTEYFKYLPAEVHRHWAPYKASSDYEVEVKFKVNRDGSITSPEIVRSTNERANTAVLNAVTSGAPYQPLPKTYLNKSVTAQIVLEYHN